MNRKKMFVLIAIGAPLFILAFIAIGYTQSNHRLSSAKNNLDTLASSFKTSIVNSEVKASRDIALGCKNTNSAFESTDFTCDTGKAVLLSVPVNTAPVEIRNGIETFFNTVKGGPIVSTGKTAGNTGFESFEKLYTETNRWAHKFAVENSGIPGVNAVNKDGGAGLDDIRISLFVQGNSSTSSKTQTQAIQNIFNIPLAPDKVTLLAYFTQKYDSCGTMLCSTFIPGSFNRDDEASLIDKLRVY